MGEPALSRPLSRSLSIFPGFLHSRFIPPRLLPSSFPRCTSTVPQQAVGISKPCWLGRWNKNSRIVSAVAILLCDYHLQPDVWHRLRG
jgi:hypothetical protein